MRESLPISCCPGEYGKIAVTVAHGDSTSTFQLSARETAELAIALLEAAKETCDRSGLPIPREGSNVGIRPIHLSMLQGAPGRETLVVWFGQAVLGLSVSHLDLRRLQKLIGEFLELGPT